MTNPKQILTEELAAFDAYLKSRVPPGALDQDALTRSATVAVVTGAFSLAFQMELENKSEELSALFERNLIALAGEMSDAKAPAQDAGIPDEVQDVVAELERLGLKVSVVKH